MGDSASACNSVRPESASAMPASQNRRAKKAAAPASRNASAGDSGPASVLVFTCTSGEAATNNAPHSGRAVNRAASA